MRNTFYVVHSDEDENNYNIEFDSMEDAVNCARDNVTDKTYVVAVDAEFNDFGEITDIYEEETIWSYDLDESCKQEECFTKEDLDIVNDKKEDEIRSKMSVPEEVKEETASEELIEVNKPEVKVKVTEYTLPIDEFYVDFPEAEEETPFVIDGADEIPEVYCDGTVCSIKPEDVENPFDIDWALSDISKAEEIAQPEIEKVSEPTEEVIIKAEIPVGTELPENGEVKVEIPAEGEVEGKTVCPVCGREDCKCGPDCHCTPEENCGCCKSCECTETSEISSEEGEEATKINKDEELDEYFENPCCEADPESSVEPSKDVPVVDCPVNPVITHSEDEKPLDCEMEKKPLEKPLTEMMANKYPEYVAKIKADFLDLVKEAQDKLNASATKADDYAILSVFFSKLSNLAVEKWDMDEYLEVFADDKAVMPMPESVIKQLFNQVFEIKNLNPLYDLGIYDGFQDAHEFSENSDYAEFYTDCVNYFNETFTDNEAEDVDLEDEELEEAVSEGEIEEVSDSEPEISEISDSEGEIPEISEQEAEIKEVSEDVGLSKEVEEKIADLILDEKEAIDGYKDAIEELSEKEEISDEAKETLEHISDEELEHIEELADVLRDGAEVKEEPEESLEEETHPKVAQDKVDMIKAFNSALTIAKENDKPIIYGYMGSDHHDDHRYYEIEPVICDDLAKCTNDVMKKYHPAGSVLVAYPGKAFVEESIEDDLSDEEFAEQLYEAVSEQIKEQAELFQKHPMFKELNPETISIIVKTYKAAQDDNEVKVGNPITPEEVANYVTKNYGTLAAFVVSTDITVDYYNDKCTSPLAKILESDPKMKEAVLKVAEKHNVGYDYVTDTAEYTARTASFRTVFADLFSPKFGIEDSRSKKNEEVWNCYISQCKESLEDTVDHDLADNRQPVENEIPEISDTPVDANEMRKHEKIITEDITENDIIAKIEDFVKNL